MGVIYLRTNKVNGKQYVGQVTTKNFKVRQRKWKSNSKYAGKAINAARAKYGIDSFDFEILIECKDEELNKWEKYYIKELNTKVPYGYNMTDGGEGVSGHSCPFTEEHKRKIGESNKNKKRSQEQKKHLSDLNKGKKHTEESKRKMSDNQPKKPVLQIDLITNEVIAEFPSIMKVERELGFYCSHISKSCLGKRKSAYGYKWRYAS